MSLGESWAPSSSQLPEDEASVHAALGPCWLSARGGEGKAAEGLSGISSLTCTWNSLATTVFMEAPVWCLSGHIARPNKARFL